MQPLTGIKAYYINSKPVYINFLSEVTAQGGDTSNFPSVNSIPDGYFPSIPWIGVVIQKNPDYEGDATQYSNLVLYDPDGKAYPLKLNSAAYFETAVTGYFGKAPAPVSQDYFDAPTPKTSGEYTATLSYGDIPYTDKVLVLVQSKTGQTKWSEIILNYGELFTDDARDKEKYDTNPASFLNEASFYLSAAIPRFNQPPPILSFLGENTPQFYQEYYWAVPGEIVPPGSEEPPTPTPNQTVVSTGFYGYEICSVVSRGVDQFGNPVDTAYLDAVYNSATGEVTFPAGLIPGTEYVICLLIDGVFQNTLTLEMKRILGLCFHMVWEYRFTGEWLARAAKVTDRSFTPPNEANWTRAQEEKRKSLEDSLNQEIKRYSQSCAYRSTVGARGNFSLV